MLISTEDRTLSFRAFSTFKILPFKGKIAWVFRSLPCFAEPPAESPSTKKSSDKAGSFSWQSASFPGNPPISSAVFLRVSSLAFRAASLALAASTIFPQIIFASEGFSNKNSCNFSITEDSTTGFTSLDTNLSLVCEENLGSETLRDKTAVSPSLASSPVMFILFFMAPPCFSIYWFRLRVKAPRKPERWVPPSFWGILLVKQ